MLRCNIAVAARGENSQLCAADSGGISEPGVPLRQ
jgi:hypothetical protein